MSFPLLLVENMTTSWPSETLLMDLVERHGVQVCEEDTKHPLVWFTIDNVVTRHTLATWLRHPNSKVSSAPNRIVFPLRLLETEEETILPGLQCNSPALYPFKRHLCLDMTMGKEELNQWREAWDKRLTLFQGWFTIGITRRHGPFHSFTPLQKSTGPPKRFLAGPEIDGRIRELWNHCTTLWMGNIYVPEGKHSSDTVSNRLRIECVQDSRAWLTELPQMTHRNLPRDQVPEYIQLKCPHATTFAMGPAVPLFDTWYHHLWTALTRDATQHQYVDLRYDSVELHWILESTNDREAIAATLENWMPLVSHLSPVHQSFLVDTLGQYLPRIWTMSSHQQAHLLPPRYWYEKTRKKTETNTSPSLPVLTRVENGSDLSIVSVPNSTFDAFLQELSPSAYEGPGVDPPGTGGEPVQEVS